MRPRLHMEASIVLINSPKPQAFVQGARWVHGKDAEAQRALSGCCTPQHVQP
ncbi:hypothetical protein [Deinococcus hopiensis]|uniref:hypothetical protein n=1 Tax=Deinococcus hopiensis TaxID=309885 RepID=UPI001482B79E|nr:hypothetical protein [Deinococcus hopiensis]